VSPVGVCRSKPLDAVSALGAEGEASSLSGEGRSVCSNHAAGKEAAIAKLFASEIAMKFAMHAIRLSASYGHSTDLTLCGPSVTRSDGSGDGIYQILCGVIARHAWLPQGLTSPTSGLSRGSLKA
jgi:alkylation response protein AidB-like acyl-CoA dehydrogenase